MNSPYPWDALLLQPHSTKSDKYSIEEKTFVLMTSPETCYPHSGHWKGLMELSVQSNSLSASKRIKSCLSRLMHFEVTNWAHYHSSNIFGMRMVWKYSEENVPDEAIVVCLFVCFDQCPNEKGLKRLIFLIKFEPNLMHPSPGSRLPSWYSNWSALANICQ